MSNGGPAPEKLPIEIIIKIITVIASVLAVLLNLITDLSFFRRVVGITAAITLIPVVIIWLRLWRKVKIDRAGTPAAKPIKHLLKKSPCLLTAGFLLSVVLVANFFVFLLPELLENHPTVQECLRSWGVITPAATLALPTMSVAIPVSIPPPTYTPTLTPTVTSTPTLTPTLTLTITSAPAPTHTLTLTPTDTPVSQSPVISASPTPSKCRPIGGAVEPCLCVAGVSVQINEGTPMPVAYEGRLTLTAGDTLRLVSLRYCASREALADGVAGEAYLFRNSVVDYENGLFTRGGPRIHADCGDAGDFDSSWIIEPEQHRVVIALMHYFSDTVVVNGYFTGTYEVDDRFFFNLDVR
jgi:hypothetical protein